MSCGDQGRLPRRGNIQEKMREGCAWRRAPRGTAGTQGLRGVLKPRHASPVAAAAPLTIRFTMMILGPSVLLMVKMCISRRQNMMKSRERTTRPGYSAAGVSLAGHRQGPQCCAPGPVTRARPPAAPTCGPEGGGTFSRKAQKPSLGQRSQAVQVSWDRGLGPVPRASRRKGTAEWWQTHTALLGGGAARATAGGSCRAGTTPAHVGSHAR